MHLFTTEIKSSKILIIFTSVIIVHALPRLFLYDISFHLNNVPTYLIKTHLTMQKRNSPRKKEKRKNIETTYIAPDSQIKKYLSEEAAGP